MKIKLPRVTRDGVIFVSGLAILFHETVIYHSPSERPQLLILAGMMIGLPAFLKKDEKTSRPDQPDSLPPANGDAA